MARFYDGTFHRHTLQAVLYRTILLVIRILNETVASYSFRLMFMPFVITFFVYVWWIWLAYRLWLCSTFIECNIQYIRCFFLCRYYDKHNILAFHRIHMNATALIHLLIHTIWLGSTPFARSWIDTESMLYFLFTHHFFFATCVLYDQFHWACFFFI